VKRSSLTGKVFGIALILAFIVAMLGGLSALVDKVEASPTTIYVPDDYTTIQAAVDAANPGDTIIVRASTYTENVDVNKEHLTIQSENGAEVTVVQAANPDDYIFEVVADYVEVNGFTVKGAIESGRSGIYIGNEVTNCHIVNNNAIDNYAGIMLYYSSNTIVSDNNCGTNGGAGIRLWHSSWNTISNNNAWDNGSGISLDVSCDQNTVTENNVQNNYYGIYLHSDSEGNMVSGNTVLNNQEGIRLDSGGNVISNNIMQSNYYDGLHLQQSSNNVITDNTMDGLRLYVRSNGNTIKNNNVNGGILVGHYSEDNIISKNIFTYKLHFQDSSNNIVYLNNFMNIVNFWYTDSTNTWQSPEEMTYIYNGNSYTSYLGNYWDDYAGSDVNGDGIGETSHPIDTDADDYPLVEPFENYGLGVPENQPPLASFTYLPYERTSAWELNPAEDESITFDASSSSDPDGLIVDYIWDLGDIGSRTGVQTEISYAEASEYTVTLTVVDDNGAIDSMTKTVKVVPEWRKELRIGDILFDSDFLGGLGHVGIYCGSDTIIEAQVPFVSMFNIETWDDPNRYDVSLIRVRCSDEVANYAAFLAFDQVGKAYDFTWYQKNADLSADHWYCSELVWALYRNAENIDLEYTPDNWAVSPLEIYLEACLGEKSYVVSQRGEPPIVPTWGGLFILALCPVDIQITDPEDLTASTNSINIPGCIYIINDVNEDGSPDDSIYIPERKIGDYLIAVIPDSGASPTDKYSLEVSAGNISIMLADDVQIGDVPSQGYIVRSTETEIEQIIPEETFPWCFIATAAYGTPMTDEVQILRKFRDEYLLTNPLGQVFTDFYYKFSPPIAEFITDHPSLKPIVRVGLLPTVVMSTVVVNTTAIEKVVILGLLVLVSVLVAVWVVRRRGRGSEYT